MEERSRRMPVRVPPYALLYKESTGGGEDRREVLISAKFSFGIWQQGRSAGRFDLTIFCPELLMETERGRRKECARRRRKGENLAQNGLHQCMRYDGLFIGHADY
jgi:hypothetical protein